MTLPELVWDTSSPTYYLRSLLLAGGNSAEPVTSGWATQPKNRCCCCTQEEVILLRHNFAKPIWVLQPHDRSLSQRTQCEGTKMFFLIKFRTYLAACPSTIDLDDLGPRVLDMPDTLDYSNFWALLP